MTHYKMLERDPSALITVNKSEPKIYQGNIIYLNSGDNFEVRLFNPLQHTLGVEVVLNGQKRNEGLIVLKPGQDITLDRFVGESRKMLFETYKIDASNPEAVKAAELNGLVEINFFEEDIPTPVYFSTMSNTAGMGGLPHFTNSRSSSNTWSPIYKNCTRSYTSSGVYLNEPDSSNIGSRNRNSRLYNDYVAENLETNIDYSDYQAESTEKTLETGRIEKGDVSNQVLKEVQISFKSYAFYTVRYQLKPTSTIPITMKEIRHYCDQCGYRQRKQNWKYCPQCGHKN